MSKLVKIGLILLIPIILFLGSWFVLHQDIVFTTDIARDFLLMNEIALKKIVFIGPRADWKGLFHGPLWLYFNFPAYWVGRGNPITVGWFWVMVTFLFSIVYYFIAKKLFNKNVAILFVPLFLSAMMTWMNRFYNPVGALFMAPFFFFFAVMYYRTKKIVDMLGCLFFVGLMVQFQLAAGIPLLILTGIFLIYDIAKSRKYTHLLGFFILLIPLSPFILFDLRHSFLQLQAVVNHFSGQEKYEHIDFFVKASNRLVTLTKDGLGLFSGNFNDFNILIGYFLSLSIFSALKSKINKYADIYLIFLYFYIGFYLVSLIHNGYVLVHYFIPLTTLPILMFVSLYEMKSKKLFALLYIFVIAANLTGGLYSARDSSEFIGKNKVSWKFLSQAAKTVYISADNRNFGLYYYAPDVYGYQMKYALFYTQSLYLNNVMNFSQKRKETFLLYEPPPPDRLYLDGIGWKKDQVKLSGNPSKVINLLNNYRIEEYILSPAQIKVQSDSLIDDWVSQR